MCNAHSYSDNIEITVNDKVNEVIQELFPSFVFRCLIGLDHSETEWTCIWLFSFILLQI